MRAKILFLDSNGNTALWRYGYSQGMTWPCSASYLNLCSLAVVEQGTPPSRSLEKSLFNFSEWSNEQTNVNVTSAWYHSQSKDEIDGWSQMQHTCRLREEPISNFKLYDSLMYARIIILILTLETDLFHVITNTKMNRRTMANTTTAPTIAKAACRSLETGSVKLKYSQLIKLWP